MCGLLATDLWDVAVADSMPADFVFTDILKMFMAAGRMTDTIIHWVDFRYR